MWVSSGACSHVRTHPRGRISQEHAFTNPWRQPCLPRPAARPAPPSSPGQLMTAAAAVVPAATAQDGAYGAPTESASSMTAANGLNGQRRRAPKWQQQQKQRKSHFAALQKHATRQQKGSDQQRQQLQRTPAGLQQQDGSSSTGSAAGANPALPNESGSPDSSFAKLASSSSTGDAEDGSSTSPLLAHTNSSDTLPGSNSATTEAGGSSSSSSKKRRKGKFSFTDWLLYCNALAASNQHVHRHRAVLGLRHLVSCVRGPAQAQQAWLLLAHLLTPRLHSSPGSSSSGGGGSSRSRGRSSRSSSSGPPPAPPTWGQELGRAAVELAQRTLERGDYSVLQRLLALPPGTLTLGQRCFEGLLLAALKADVDPTDLQAIMQLVPPAAVSPRAYHHLLCAFLERQQYMEAQHVAQQLGAAGAALSPALQRRLALLSGRVVGSKSYK